VRAEDIELFRELGVIPAMQPTHCTSDMGFVEDRVGEQRARGAYAWRSFRDAGLILPLGSDFPVESANPLWGIYAAITRQDHDGLPEGGWYPGQRLTREEAIRGYTIWAAHAAFQEELVGSLEKGKLADFVVLDTNILDCEPEELLTARALLTVIGGEVRYRHPESME
jgi:predicted amidohydrolase YtcJ